jgi:spore maturation protein CgeB
VKILIIGVDKTPDLGGVFRRAAESLGHQVCFVDESLAYCWLDAEQTRPLLWRLRRNLPAGVRRFRSILLRRAKEFLPDIVLALKGAYLDPETLQELKRATSALLVNFSTDDPFNDAPSTPCIRPCLPFWDVYATPRSHTIPELQRHCQGQVVYLPFAYDPASHFPETQIPPEDANSFASDLAFIGVCDADRVETLTFLANQKSMVVGLYGGGKRYRLIKDLRRCHRGFAMGRNYRLALACSKVALSLNRTANRDTHVMRTFEIPACGAFLLAQRTDEQCEMFAEDREAVFFSGQDELMDKAVFYLRQADLRRQIAQAGFHRVTSGRNTYRDRLLNLLHQVGVKSPCAA